MDKLRGAWKSLTIWLNGILLAAFPLVGMVKENLPDIGQYLDPALFKWLGLAVVVMNIVLRFRTKSDLADK